MLAKENVNRWLCCFLVLMIPFSWVNTDVGSVYRLVVLAVFAVFLFNNRFKIQLAKKSIPLFNAWTVYTIYAILTALWAAKATQGFNNAMGLILLYLMSLVFLSVTYDGKTKRLLELCWLIATVFLIILFLFDETVQLGVSGRRTLILLGTETDANEFASFFVVGFCVVMNLFFKEKQKGKKFLLIIIALAIVYVVLTAASRGAFFSLIPATLVTAVVALSHVSKKKVLSFTLLGILLLIGAVILILPLIPQDNLDRITIGAILEDRGTGRLVIWSSAINSFLTGDVWRMIIGYGYGRFGVETGYGSSSMVMHNQFLQQLISYGIIGLMLYGVMIYNCFARFRSHFCEYLGAFVGVTVMSLTLTMGPSYKILWIVLFIAMMQTSSTQEYLKISNKNGNR